VVSFDRVGPEQYAVRVPNRPPAELAPYEAQVYEHVRGLASGGVVPCEALTTGPEDESTKWWKQFRKAVSADARQRGLSRNRWAPAHLVTLGIVAAAPAGLSAAAFAALPSSSKDDNSGGWIFAGLVVWAVLMAVPRHLRAERDTPAGLATAGKWFGLRTQLAGDDNFAQQPPTAIAIWDRLLSYGAAMGVAPGAVRPLPMGAESETQAWTAYGGRWRLVRVHYPSRVPPGWGRSAPSAIGLGLLWVVPAVFLAYVTRDLRGIVYLAIVAVGLLAFAYGASLLWSGVSDIGRRRTVEGQVLRRKEIVSNSNSGKSTTAVLLAVYGGNGNEVRALRCTPQVASGVRAGELVRATVSPHLAHVYVVERLAPMVS